MAKNSKCSVNFRDDNDDDDNDQTLGLEGNLDIL